EPFASFCLAAAEHDNGWSETELQPGVDPKTRLPYSFMSIPTDEHILIYQRGIERLVKADHYAALLVCMHAAGLYDKARATMPGFSAKYVKSNETQPLHEVVRKLRLVRFHILRRKSGHRRPRLVVQPRGVHADQQGGVMIRLHQPLDSPLINQNVLIGWNGHKAVRQPRLRIDSRLQLRLAPPVVVLRRRKTERRKRLRLHELLVSPLFCEKSGQKRMIRLPDQQKLVALFLNDHEPASRSAATSKSKSRLGRQGVPARQRGNRAIHDRFQYYAPPARVQSSAIRRASPS